MSEQPATRNSVRHHFPVVHQARRPLGKAMARPPRQFVVDFPAHVVHRGNNRVDVFRCPRDLHFYRRCIRDAARIFGVRVNAYVLMTNHVHLLMTPSSTDAISRTMHSASHRYTHYFNKAYSRCGALWQPRFYASVIDNDRYLLACHRYIDMNPVRAGLAVRPEGYLWSSHRFHALGERDDLVTPHARIVSLSENESGRRQAYRSLFQNRQDETDFDVIRKALRAGVAVTEKPPQRGRPRKMVSDTIS